MESIPEYHYLEVTTRWVKANIKEIDGAHYVNPPEGYILDGGRAYKTTSQIVRSYKQKVPQEDIFGNRTLIVSRKLVHVGEVQSDLWLLLRKEGNYSVAFYSNVPNVDGCEIIGPVTNESRLLLNHDLSKLEQSENHR